MSDQETLNRALQHHGSGNLGEAEKLYRVLLEHEPAHSDALQYLGVIQLQVGRFDEAVALLQRAVDARPDYVDAIINLGNGLQALDRHEPAIEQFERVLALAPEHPIALANLGGALAQLGRHPEAVKRFEAALAIQPELADARRSLADSLVEVGRPNDALTEISKAITSGPPSLAIQVSMANILGAAGRGDDAVTAFLQILAAQPHLTQVRGNLGNVLRRMGALDEAIEQYTMVLNENPQYVEGHYNIGRAYQDLGDKDFAEAAYRKALELDPTCAKAWQSLATLSTRAPRDAEVEKLLALERNPDTRDDDRMQLAFGLGRHFEKMGQHEKAAEQFLLANPLRRRIFDGYDVENDLRIMRNIAQGFDKAYLEQRKTTGVQEERPIFVVGMPRSGTTLVEQILASHPRVHGAGELMLLHQSILDAFPAADDNDYHAALSDATAEKFQTIANRYLDGLPDVDADRVTDKLPHNFLNIGMIRIMFPEAHVVHCRRDPRDTCFSIYKNLFGSIGHPYAYDLEELAHHHNGYAKLMQHWDKVLPGVVHTIDYEAIIDDQERTTRELLAACGLEWDPACLDFHKLSRPVATLSDQQVRQPLYRGSIGAWQNYEKMLKPLLDILEHGGD